MKAERWIATLSRESNVLTITAPGHIGMLILTLTFQYLINFSLIYNIPIHHTKWISTYYFSVIMLTTTTATTILWSSYKATCISWHPQLRTGGFCCSKVLLPSAHMPLLTATYAFRLGRRRQSSPQWCYAHLLCTSLIMLRNRQM